MKVGDRNDDLPDYVTPEERRERDGRIGDLRLGADAVDPSRVFLLRPEEVEAGEPFVPVSFRGVPFCVLARDVTDALRRMSS